MNGSGWVFKVWRHGRTFAMIVGLLAFSARAGATGFFKYAYEFKNGTRLLYLTETTEGYVPGVFLQGRGEEYAHPLESSTSAGEGRGEVWFLECPHVESRFLSVRAEANGAQIQINRTPRSELAFVGTGNRILAIHQDGRFATVADFSKILSSHPGATVQFVTAPGTVSEAGASYRAFEIRFYVPRIDGKDELIIRRGLVSLDFDVVEFPEVRIPLPGLHPQAPVLDFGLIRGSKGPILAFNQLAIHDGDLSMVRSQLYFSDLNQAAAALGDFPLRSRDLALPLPASRHFVEEYAHESFFEFEKRVYGGASAPKTAFQRLAGDLDGLRGLLKFPSQGFIAIKGEEELRAAVSWLSYQEAVHQLIDATRPAPQPLPVISYVPPVGLSEGPGLDRYFHDLDAIRDFVKIQPVYLIVPDREAGAWRLHFVDHSNVQHFFDFLRRDFNPCDLLLRK